MNTTQLTEANIPRAGEVVIPENGGVLILVLNDGETWTDLDGCQIVRLTQEQHEEMECGSDPDDIETPLEVVADFRTAS